MSDSKTPKEIAREDFEKKLNFYNVEQNELKAKMKEFGLADIDKFKTILPEITPFMEKGITFAHKDFDIIADAIIKKKKWAVVSGINPSGPLHLGHLGIFKENLALQKMGADIFIPVSEDETYVFEKAASLKEARKNAYEYVIPSLIALGYDPEKTHIFLGADYPSIYHFALHISKYFSLNQLKGVFGFSDDASAGVVFYTGAIQIAHIMMPELPEFGGPRPVVVQVAIDQHPYVQVSRRYARKAGLIPPAELSIRFLPSLEGPQSKMAASVKSSSIYVTDLPDVAKSKIKTAYTGGSPLLEFQKEHGAVPGVCSIYGILQYHILDAKGSEQLWQRCKGGKQYCRDCKEMAQEGVAKLLIDHQSKFKDAKKNIDSFMLKSPIRSISSYSL